MDLRCVDWGDVDWIYLVQDREQWRAILNTVIELSGCIKDGIS
jgi:hypothetical protein